MKIMPNIGCLAIATITAISFLLFCAQPAWAEDLGQLSSSDYRFVCEAAKGGGIEISLSQLALEKSGNPDIHHFAERMVKDHGKANDELAHLASQKGAVFPDISSDQKEMADKFRSYSGAEFDKAYVKQMVRDHEKTVELFQKEAGDAEDPDLKDWVVKTLPTLQEHLDMAHKLRDEFAPAK
jgi:putative membrane protein